MTKYIDANALLKLYEPAPEDANEWDGYTTTISVIRQNIMDAPAADVVEVVRCKDCIYSRFYLDMSEKAAPWLLCKKLRDAMFPLMVAKTDYCCWAERKEVQG